jgi:hypothetical protein
MVSAHFRGPEASIIKQKPSNTVAFAARHRYSFHAAPFIHHPPHRDGYGVMCSAATIDYDLRMHAASIPACTGTRASHGYGQKV